MNKIRKELYCTYDKPLATPGVYFKIAGSKREEITRYMESDWDVLFMDTTVMCVEENHIKESYPDDVCVFAMVPCASHPGHIGLLYVRGPLQESNWVPYVTTSDNGCWLSSKKITGVEKSPDDRKAGPAINTLFDGETEVDSVITFPCKYSSVLKKWQNRTRRHDWPSVDIINRISEQNGNVVAAGIKGCENEATEWRLCFNESEAILVDSWNETQTKLYIILKMIKKDSLYLPEKQITSYMMKNIVFWLSENNPLSAFRPETLFTWVIQGLRLLKRSIKHFHLPYYIIPERNLISEKVPFRDRKQLMRQLNSAINSGPLLLLRCSKIAFSMKMSPLELLIYRDKCNLLELLMFKYVEVYHKVLHAGFGDTDLEIEFTRPFKRQQRLLMDSEWPDVAETLLQSEISYEGKLRLLLN